MRAKKDEELSASSSTLLGPLHMGSAKASRPVIIKYYKIINGTPISPAPLFHAHLGTHSYW
jgi:hypothetical protein